MDLGAECSTWDIVWLAAAEVGPFQGTIGSGEVCPSKDATLGEMKTCPIGDIIEEGSPGKRLTK